MPRNRFGIPFYAGPLDYSPLAHSLYRNRGDGTFENVSERSGIAARPGPGMGVVSADLDDDGDADLVVANDQAPNFCFLNDGGGNFREVGAQSGLAYNGEGVALGNMGVDCADYDHDGKLDFFFTPYPQQLPVLVHNLGKGCFRM